MAILQRQLVAPMTQTVPVGGVTFGPFMCNGSVLTITVENTGATALATFVMQVKCHPSDLAFQTVISGATWATTNPLIVNCSALATLGAGLTGYAQIKTAGFYQIQFTATSASSTDVVNVQGQFTEAQ